MHSGPLAPHSNGSLAAGFDNAGTNAEALRAEFRITHAMTVPCEVIETLAGFVVRFGVKGKCSEDLVDSAVVEFIASLFCPLSSQVAAGAVDGLRHIPEVALRMVEIEIVGKIRSSAFGQSLRQAAKPLRSKPTWRIDTISGGVAASQPAADL